MIDDYIAEVSFIIQVTSRTRIYCFSRQMSCTLPM